MAPPEPRFGGQPVLHLCHPGAALDNNTRFGQVTSGMDVVGRIKPGDKMKTEDRGFQALTHPEARRPRVRRT